MTVSQVKASLGPTSFVEKARLTGEFADWSNLFDRAAWITGALNKAAVRDAWRRVCQRHDVLRRTYVSADEACTYGDALSDVEFHTAETDEEAIELMRRCLGTPFSLDGPGFSRIVIVQRSERRHLFGIVMDHIITDLMSWMRIRADFRDLYDRALAGDAGEAADVTDVNSYQSFASAQHRFFSGEWGEERRAFWRSYVGEFGTYPPPFSIGAEHTGEYHRKVITRDLPADAQSRVHAFSRQARATPFAVVSSGVLAGLREVADDPRVGITVNQHGRMLPGTSQTPGLFAQTVPLHLGRQSTSPLDIVQEVFHRSLDVFEYGIPLLVAGRSWNETLMVVDKEAGLYVELNEYPRIVNHVPLFTGTGAEYIDLSLDGEKLWAETTVVSWNLFETGPQLVADYNANYFPDAAVAKLLEAAERFVLSLDAPAE